MYVGKRLFAAWGWPPPAPPPAAGAGAEGVLGAHALRSGMLTAVASAPASKFRRLRLRCSRLSITARKPPPDRIQALRVRSGLFLRARSAKCSIASGLRVAPTLAALSNATPM